MNLLVFSQILFNLVASIAIVVFGALFAVAVYHLIGIIKNLQNISDNLDNVTDELKTRITEVIDKLSSLPIFSYFLKTRYSGNNKSHNKKRP
ncbi:MAG: hypothetical protein AAB795_02565 [Patescibacteria group bacterium]